MTVKSESGLKRERKSFKWPKFLKLPKSQNSKKTKIFLFCMMFLPFVFGVGYDFFNKIFTIKLMFSDEAGTGFGVYYIQQAFRSLSAPGSELSIAIKNALIMPLLFNFLFLPFQLVVAYFLYRKIPGTKGFRIILYMPCLISQIVTSTIFFIIFQSDGALVTQLVAWGVEIPVDGLFQSKETAMLMIYVFQFWVGSGVTMTIATAAMNGVNPEMIEAARMDGIGFWGEFFYMIIPSMLPMLSVWFVQNMASGMGFYTEILLFTPDPLLSESFSAAYLITEKAKALGRAQYESAGYGFIFTLVAIPLIYGTRKLLEKIVPDNSY